MRYSISTLLFLMLIFALYFPASDLFRPLWIGWFKNQFPEYCHFEQLKVLKPGDSEREVFEKVHSLRKVPLDQSFDVILKNQYGITTDDSTFLLTYDSEKYMSAALLLHNGKLVEGYTGNTNNFAARNVPIPKWWHQGQLPIFLMHLIFVSPIIWIWFLGTVNPKQQRFLETLKCLSWLLLAINLFSIVGGIICLMPIGNSDVFLTERFGRSLCQTITMLYPLGCCFAGFVVNLQATRGSGHSFINVFAIITINTLMLIAFLCLLRGIDTHNEALTLLFAGVAAFMVGKFFQFIWKSTRMGSHDNEIEISENTPDGEITIG